MVRRHGRVHAQGMYLTAAPPDILRTLVNKNLTVSPTIGETPDETAECLAMMADGKITANAMVTEIAHPRDATEVHDAVYRHPAQFVRCAFKW